MKEVRMRVQPSALVFGVIMQIVALVLIAAGIGSLFGKDYFVAAIGLGVGSFFTWHLLTTPMEIVAADGRIRLRGLRPRQEVVANLMRVDRVRSAWIRAGWACSFIRRDGTTAFEITEFIFDPRALRTLMDSLGIPMYGEPPRLPSPRAAWTNAQARERLVWVLFATALVAGLLLVLAKSALGIVLVALLIPLAFLAMRAGGQPPP